MGEFGSKCQEKKQPDHPVQLQPIPTQGTDRHGKRSEPTAAAACHIGLEECNPVSLTLSVSHRKTDEFPWIMHDELSLFAPLSRRPVNVGVGGELRVRRELHGQAGQHEREMDLVSAERVSIMHNN